MEHKPLKEKINIDLQDSNTYNALVEIALLTNSYLTFDYEEKTIGLVSKEDVVFDKGFQLSPFFNMQEIDISLSGESLFPILHVQGGEDDMGLVVGIVPYLPYSSWEILAKSFENVVSIGNIETHINKMREGVFYSDNMNSLNIQTYDSNFINQLEVVPYIDSFLIDLEYFEENGNLLEDGGNVQTQKYKDFLKLLYIDLTQKNIAFQIANIKHILIEEQIIRIQRKIDVAAEAVATAKDDIYKEKSDELDSLFLDKGGRQSEAEQETFWVEADALIPGTNKTYRAIYKNDYVFVEIRGDEYSYYLQTGYELWNESAFTGSDIKVVHTSESQSDRKYFYSEKNQGVEGLEISLQEKWLGSDSSRYHTRKFEKNKNLTSTEIISLQNDIPDDSLWTKWDNEDNKRFINKKLDLSLTSAGRSLPEVDPFNDKDDKGNKKYQYSIKGNQIWPIIEKEKNTSYENYYIREEEWEISPGNSKYKKLVKDPSLDNRYTIQNESVKEVYSGTSNPTLSYPVKYTGNFISPSGNEPHYYPLKNGCMLVLDQEKEAYIVCKENPNTKLKIFIGIDEIPKNQIYRVFFYDEEEFALSWSESSTTSGIGLFKITSSTSKTSYLYASKNKRDIGSRIQHTIGGWYYEKTITIDDIRHKSNPTGDQSNRYTASRKIDGLGTRLSIFSEEALIEDLTNIFKDEEPILHTSIQGAVATKPSSFGVGQHLYYARVMIRLSRTPQKAFYFKHNIPTAPGATGNRIVAITWDDSSGTIGEKYKKAWQLIDIIASVNHYITTYDKNLIFFSKARTGNTWTVTYKYFNENNTKPINETFEVSDDASAEELNLHKRRLLFIESGSTWEHLYFLSNYNEKIKYLKTDTGRVSTSGPQNQSKVSKVFPLNSNNFLVLREGSNEEWRGSVELLSNNTLYSNRSFFEIPQTIDLNYDEQFLYFEDTIFVRNTKLDSNNNPHKWKISRNNTIDFGDMITDSEMRGYTKTGALPKNSKLIHLEASYEKPHKLEWGNDTTTTTTDISPSSYISSDKIKAVKINHKKSALDMIRYETPYLDLLNIFKGHDSIRDLNYSYLREIDYYIQERKKIELLKSDLEISEEERAFYDSEIESFEAEIGNINDYIVNEEIDTLEGKGQFWKYRTKKEYEEGISNPINIEGHGWKNYSLKVNGTFSVNVPKDHIIVYETITNNGFWTTQVEKKSSATSVSFSSGTQIRKIEIFNAKNKDLIKIINSIIVWKNYFYYDSNGQKINIAAPSTELNEEHIKIFYSQPEKFRGAMEFKDIDENTVIINYATTKGRLSLKQERFEKFMYEREQKAMLRMIRYEDSTHGQLQEAKKQKNKVWFDMKQLYPEIMLEGYYTNETENDSYNLLDQATKAFKYHNKPSEEYSITYLERDDLIGNANDVRVGDKISIRSRLVDQLGLSEKLQVTAISRELRDPSNVQIEVSPMRRSSLLEKVFGTVKRK